MNRSVSRALNISPHHALIYFKRFLHNMNIQDLSSSDLNWLIWGGVFFVLLLSWAVLRIRRVLTQMQTKLAGLIAETKKLNHQLSLLLSHNNINVEAGDDIDETKLYVGNIDYAASEAELASLFAKYGQIDMVNIPLDRYTGKARGFGFVTFKKAADAIKAMGLDGSDFKGRQIQVNFARERASSN